jgi:predicted rRNA methylase YqxC with S4 and FtsJ domains
VSSGKRAPFVALTVLLRQRFPCLDDLAQQIAQGLVLVNGAVATNPQARVRSDAAVRILRRQPLRGTIKLTHALDIFSVRTTDTGSPSTWVRQPEASPRHS